MSGTWIGSKDFPEAYRGMSFAVRCGESEETLIRSQLEMWTGFSTSFKRTRADDSSELVMSELVESIGGFTWTGLAQIEKRASLTGIISEFLDR